MFDGHIERITAAVSTVGRYSLADRIYERLRTEMMSGAYEPGSRLNIRALAAIYETSQTPVREAIMRLVADGAIELKPSHQPRVPILSIPRYLEIRETRVPLERLATELAVSHLTDNDIDALERENDSFLAAEDNLEWKKALAFNQAFHFGIYRKANNSVLVSVIENLWLLSGPFITNQYPAQADRASGWQSHIRILDALRRRSSSEAGDLIVRDLRDGSYRILERLRGGTQIKNAPR